MKRSKFSLILALVVILALVAPFATYATDTDAELLATTSETTNDEAVTTSESTNDEAVTTSESEETEILDETLTDGTDEDITEDSALEEELAEEEALEEITGNYYEMNSNLVFNKAVDGNVFLAGDTVTIKGKVNGDLYVCASNVTLEKDSQVYGNFFVIADTFTQSGLVYNLFAATTNYICEYDGLTALDLKVFAKNIKFSGYAERTAYFASNNIELTEDAYILGNFVYSSSNEPSIAEQATIYGETLNEDLFSMISDPSSQNQVVDYIISALTLLGSVLLILLIVNFFKPNALSAEMKFNFVKSLKALGIGALTVIILSIAIFLLLLSAVFAQVAFILLVGFILALMLSTIIVIIIAALVLSNLLNKGKSKLFTILYAVLVTLVYFALTIIPFVGGIVSFVISLTGFGFIVLWLLNIRKSNKISDVKAEETAKNEDK